jgi:hypothetical protein
MRFSLPSVAVCIACMSLATAPARAAGPSPADIEFFEKNIRPVLVEQCYKCHSAASEKIKGGLLVDTREGLLKGGDGGPSIVPGNPDNSPLIIALRYTDEDMQMPPKHQLPAEQIKLLEKWVRMGAPDPREGAPAKPLASYDFAKAKTFWSFQPVKDPTPPTAVSAEWSGHPIDRFIAAKHAQMKLSPGTLVDRRTLIRRATFDLIGLPPTPAEVEAFVNDTSPNAWETVLNRLLASPAYGEKWGRHWLDLVRYADSSGCNADFPVAQAYKYRNYVIESFNRDKPYDQFLKEQIAGDLLPHKDDAQNYEQIVATGYLAIARRFGSSAHEFHLTLDDAIDNMGKSMIGLSLGCARCHDHKFDPIPTADYYALFGILNSTKYAFPGTELFPHPKDFTILAKGEKADAFRRREAEMAALDQHYQELVAIRRPIAVAEKEAKSSGKPAAAKSEAVLGALLAATTPALVPRSALSLPATIYIARAQAEPPARTLADVSAEMAAIKAKLKQMENEPVTVERAYAVFDGSAANAHILRKGDPKTPGDEVPRGFLQVLGGQKLPATEKGSGRRELADWIADKSNPLTARVMVNRIWQGHFGKGLVQTPNDFGTRGKPPTHPELLDWLASRFIESGWSIKSMHRLILTSRAYQLASDDENESRQARNVELDVNNEYLWRFNRRRMEAEEVRDSLLAISGAMESGEGGPHPFPPESEWKYTQHRPFVATYETNRRSVYLMQQRIKRHPFLEVFDGADTNAVTAGRARETSPLQALFYLNDPLAYDSADRFAARLTSNDAQEDQRIDLAYQLCFSRPATSEERLIAHEYLRDTHERMEEAGVLSEQQPRAALASYLRVQLGSNEFFYID